jgi:hypothetical protein
MTVQFCHASSDSTMTLACIWVSVFDANFFEALKKSKNRGIKMKIDLTDLNEIYLSANAGNLPNGVYPARLIKADVHYSKAGNRQIVWDLEVRIPATGQTVMTKKFSPLLPENMYWVKLDLKKVGVVLRHVGELHAALDGMVGAMIEIEVDADDDHHSVHFIRMISGPGL